VDLQILRRAHRERVTAAGAAGTADVATAGGHPACLP